MTDGEGTRSYAKALFRFRYHPHSLATRTNFFSSLHSARGGEQQLTCSSKTSLTALKSFSTRLVNSSNVSSACSLANCLDVEKAATLRAGILARTAASGVRTAGVTARRLARPVTRQATRRIEAISGRIGRGWSGLREARVLVMVERRRARARREDFV